MKVTTAQIEDALDTVFAAIEQELRTPRENRTIANYERLAVLHRQEAACWKDYLELCRRRVAWMAASAAVDRAYQLAERYGQQAVALMQDSGELWPAECEAGEAA